MTAHMLCLVVVVVFSGCATYSPPSEGDPRAAEIAVRFDGGFLQTFCILEVDGVSTVPGGALHIKRPPASIHVLAGRHTFKVQYTSGSAFGVGVVEAEILPGHRYAMISHRAGLTFTADLKDEADGSIVGSML